MESQIPTFKQMYYNDLIFKSFIKMIYGPLIFFVAIYFVEPMFRLIVTAMTIPLSILGILLTIYRYKMIQSTFQDGITVKAKLLYRENIVTERSKNSSAVKRRAYFVNIGYQVQGVDYKQRVRIPNSFFLYGIKHDGQEFDVVLKKTSPKKVLIKHIYLDYDPTIPNE